MNVLWITNIVFPEAMAKLIGSSDLKSSGGWMLGAANALINKHDIKLTVASVSNKVSKLTRLEGRQIVYFILPFGKGNFNINLDYIPYWRIVQDLVNPDVVHIHGTEYSHGYAYMEACGSANVVISIQGLTSAYYYYYYGMTKGDIYSNLTFRDLIRGGIINDQKSFKYRSEIEKAMLRKCKHIIGRTSWDRARTWSINPEANYYFCNEILRDEFYDGTSWSYHQCRKHSIFLSQASYPIKGLHQVLKAMPLILRHFPDTIVRVAGYDITKANTFYDKLKMTGYGLYIKRLIKKLKLDGKVTFTGNLNAEEMKNEYLKSNVFICPSTIENSPNSLGEAQILGVPCIASYVGGIPDMMDGNEENLYRFEEVEMLAEKVCRIFSNEGDQKNMIETAQMRHDPATNGNKLYSIYKSLKG